MKLSDLKKFTARRRAQISFQLPNGAECVIDSHGVARVPSLREVPTFNLDECLERIQTFQVVTASGEKPKSVPRAEVEKLISSLGGTPSQQAEHDE